MKEIMFTMAEKLAEDWYDTHEIPYTEEMVEVNDRIYALFWKNPAFTRIRFDLEEAISLGECLCEKQGFLEEFKYALELLCKEAKA